MDEKEQLIKIKEETGLNWKEFAKYYGIPYRTMQDWYLGRRKMPDYLLRLMTYKYKIERYFETGQGACKGED